MPFDFHTRPDVYLQHQVWNAEKSILPFIAPHLPTPGQWSGTEVLELGCGEGGNLKPFADAGARCTGIDLNKKKIDEGREIMQQYIEAGLIDLYFDDIFNPAIAERFRHRFDAVILKDVIEHVPDKARILRQIATFLKPGTGVLFIGWPPWAMPFGGHQQVAHSKALRTLPWFHLLPKSLYHNVLRMAGEPQPVVEELMQIRRDRVPLNMMYRLLRDTGLRLVDEKWYLINPIYEYKFKLRTREQVPLLRRIPLLRDLLTTSVYFLLKPEPGARP